LFSALLFFSFFVLCFYFFSLSICSPLLGTYSTCRHANELGLNIISSGSAAQVPTRKWVTQAYYFTLGASPKS